MAGVRFNSTRFDFSFELYDDAAVLRLAGKEERWARELLLGCAEPKVVTAIKFDALVFGTRAVVATQSGVWTIEGDFPIWSVEEACDVILVIEELSLRTYSHDGVEIARAMPRDIPHAWSVERNRLIYEDFEHEQSVWSLPDLRLVKPAGD